MSEFKQQLWSMDMLPKDILIGKIKRLEQALEEIKEIAEPHQKEIKKYVVIVITMTIATLVVNST